MMIREVLDYIAKFLGWFVIITSIIPIIIIHVTDILTLGHIDAKVVVGYSEFPKLMPGDIIFILKTKNLKVGEIGCYIIPSNSCSINKYVASKGDIICHDVIGMGKIDNLYYYKFKGTANKRPDPCNILETYVIGKVIFKVPLIGIGVIPFIFYINTIKYLIFGGYI